MGGAEDLPKKFLRLICCGQIVCFWQMMYNIVLLRLLWQKKSSLECQGEGEWPCQFFSATPIPIDIKWPLRNCWIQLWLQARDQITQHTQTTRCLLLFAARLQIRMTYFYYGSSRTWAWKGYYTKHWLSFGTWESNSKIVMRIFQVWTHRYQHD